MKRRDLLKSGIAFLPASLSAQTDKFPKIPELTGDAKQLSVVIRLSDAMRSVPNAGNTRLRLFQGWPLSGTSASAVPAAVSAGPGPTLRAKVGSRVNIMLLNAIDDANFSYNQPDGCDAGSKYPFNDTFPNCIHGSSIANLHFHGIHTDPNGFGDNVLIQIIPKKDTKQEDWTAILNKVFAMPAPPQSWSQVPVEYQKAQIGYTVAELQAAKKLGKMPPPKGLLADYDNQRAAAAKANGIAPPQALWPQDVKTILQGQWPQYLVGAFPNTIQLPDFAKGGMQAGQSPGTHWYHAHKHGSTSIHIFNGLAGALIVEGDYDQKLRAFFSTQPGAAGLVERVVVFQTILATQNLIKATGQTGGPTGDNPNAGNNQKLINGQISPTISMRPGEVQFWRLLNAMGGGGKGTIDPTMFNALTKAGFTIAQVAMDGVQFSWDNYLDQPYAATANGQTTWNLTLAGGNRADILIQAPTTPGTTPVLVPNDLNNATGAQSLLFQVEVAGTPANMRLFGANDKAAYPVMPAYLQNLPAPNKDPRIVSFTMNSGAGLTPNPPGFFINGRKFEESKAIEFCLTKNAVEDWLITNDGMGAGGYGAQHPFHIHINPFQILEIANPATGTTTKFKFPVWQDVVALPVGGWVKIRHKFADFTGTYVLHCHILAHEDRGMMQLVRVIPAGTDPKTACSINLPAHH